MKCQAPIYGVCDGGKGVFMPKPVEQELAEADRMHALAVKMRAQKDTTSADMLESKVRTKRRKAINRMGKRVGGSKGGKKGVV